MKPCNLTIKELSQLIRDLKPTIGDDYRASYDDDDDLPGIQITVGYDPDTQGWTYQTGDNSYYGNAYGYPIWGVSAIYRRSNSREVARDLIEQIKEQMYQ